MTMKLYILAPIAPNDRPWDPWYDKAFAFVVRAESESAARHIASWNCGDEGKEAWLNPSLSTCDELTADGDPGVVCKDFHSA